MAAAFIKTAAVLTASNSLHYDTLNIMTWKSLSVTHFCKKKKGNMCCLSHTVLSDELIMPYPVQP